MKFNSTTYLFYILRNKLNLDTKTAENCLRLLNGFIVIPSSIEFDKNFEILLFRAQLPHSKFLPSEVTISKKRGLCIYGQLADYRSVIMALNFSITTASSSSVMILEDGTSYSGIYYHYSDAALKDGKYMEKHSFYDAGVLREVKMISRRESININDLIGNNPNMINNFGFMPDAEFIEGKPGVEVVERANKINRIIRRMDYSYVIKQASKLKPTDYDSNSPISIK